MKKAIIPIIGMSILLWLPVSGNGADSTTRQQTIIPVAIPDGTPQVAPSNVPQYAVYGYSAWQWGGGTNEGRKFDLMPAGYTGANNTARLLSFFSMSDVHITDKESPAQVPYLGWSAPFQEGNSSAYSPVILSTTHVLDAAVKTINALHSQTPFDFGICLGDVANNAQFNELRWFIDVMDGQYITPSSGDHLSATNIDYQMPYQAAGLDRSIPWYQVIGNHDQFWMGSLYATDKVRQALVGANVLNIDTNLYAVNALDSEGMYVGVVDGTTPYGDVIKGGLTNWYSTTPTVAADTNRHTLTTDSSSTTNYMSEFFNTASFPVGHGFNRANIENNSACYTFVPLTNMPIKVIVLDDAAKTNIPNAPAIYGALGQVDVARYAWLTNELQMGQDADQLMIVATHIPVNPQADLFNTNSFPIFYNHETETNLIATLHRYPNLILLMAGHIHRSVVTPQPSPDPDHPEYGFWEVETPSLRDFPQQFRTWDIRRNSDNTISILTADVDPQVETNSPAWKSRGYAVGAARIFGNISPTDTTSHVYNAELVKQLTPAMQAKIALYGTPLNQSPVYRLYCSGESATYEHLFTINETEKDVLSAGSSWTYEGVAWYAMTNEVSGSVPLYRLYCSTARQHHYTVSQTEYDYLSQNAGSGWNGEGVQYYVYSSQVTDTLPVYRFYNAAYVLHHFTISAAERDAINANPAWGYTDEGTAFYVYQNAQ